MTQDEEVKRFDDQAGLIDDAVLDGILAGVRHIQQNFGDEGGDVALIFCGASGAMVRLIDHFRQPGIGMRQAIDSLAQGMHLLAKQKWPEDYQ